MTLAEQLEAATIKYRVTRGDGGRVINVRAYAGKKAVGRMGAVKYTPYWFDMGALVVDEQFQRQGIASELFARLVKAVKGTGVKGLRSQGYQRSPDATKLWRSLVSKGKARADGSDFYAESLEEAMAGDPFTGLSLELQTAINTFASHLAWWMGNVNVLSVKKLHQLWAKTPELRQWLAKHVNLAGYTLYYGTQTADRSIAVGDPWKGPRGTQHWSTDRRRSQGFAGLHGRAGKWRLPGGVLIEAKARGSQVIVDVDRFSIVAGQHPASFRELMTRSSVAALFSGESYEGEVLTTSAVKGRVVEVGFDL
jgi:GNAT superfamily N-acetyltransferase